MAAAGWHGQGLIQGRVSRVRLYGMVEICVCIVFVSMFVIIRYHLVLLSISFFVYGMLENAAWVVAGRCAVRGLRGATTGGSRRAAPVRDSCGLRTRCERRQTCSLEAQCGG